ncbi:BrnT family toxin [Gemmatimonas sp.]|uniref:BrnT family toxin n=1 Tax=Gemmatimonas sp. TaxID=1962908 RepID=UPI00286C09E3|nr:BrnT family toxin [Gemmatimonas sp.]
MTFDWDPAKSDQNLTERGFDFAFAALVFAGPYVEFDDTRRDYGERRMAALGLADGIPLSVVFTDRLTPTGAVVRRLISARLSNRKERRRYAESLEAIRLEDDRA